MLTDNVLLEIFDFCRLNDHLYQVWRWHSLVQVCRRWRQIIFASPRRLDLKLLCTDKAPASVRKYLSIWPAIPIIVKYGYCDADGRNISPDEDNIIAALEHPDRVCRVELDIKGSQLGKIAKVMQEPFPVLTLLSISSEDDSEDEKFAALPGGFLGGSAPCLQELELSSISFPALSTLLLSANDLVELKLRDVPPTGYISPEAMVVHLVTLPRLETFHIGFQSADSRPDRMLLLPETRAVLPALHELFVFSVCGYSEDFLARIDTPQLNSIALSYLDHVDFEVPQLFEFINRSENLKDILSSQCEIMPIYDDDAVNFSIGGVSSDKAERCDSSTGISVEIVCDEIDRQIMRLTHMLGWISPILSEVVHLIIDDYELFISEHDNGLDELDDMQWVQLLRPFSSIQTLFVSETIAGDISCILDYMAEVTVNPLLPALELLCLEHQPLSSVDNFAAAVRQDSVHPVTIVNTKREFEGRLKSYPY